MGADPIKRIGDRKWSFRLSFSGFFTNNFAATSMKPMKSRLITYNLQHLNGKSLVATLITVGRCFDTRNLASTNIGFILFGLSLHGGFSFFGGESPTPPAENEGKHYL